MNWLDILLIVVIAWTLINGFRKGLAREGIGLLAVIAGLLCGFWFYGIAGGYLHPYISSREIANLAGFLIIFFGVLVLGMLLGLLVASLLKAARLSAIDRLFGGAFGLIKGVLISAVIILAIMAFTLKPPPQSVVNSRLAPYVIDGARLIVAAAPRDLRDGFQRSYERVKKAWGGGLRRPKTEEL